MARQYKIADLPAGQRGKVVAEFTEFTTGLARTGVLLHLPEHTRGEFAFEIVEAIQRAYRAGREDATSNMSLEDEPAATGRETGQ